MLDNSPCIYSFAQNPPRGPSKKKKKGKISTQDSLNQNTNMMMEKNFIVSSPHKGKT